MKTLKSSLTKAKMLPFLIAVFFASTSFKPENWPQFRGPNSNQLTSEKILPLEWGNEKNLKWKYDLTGRGWSCPIVWGNKVFFTNAVLEDPTGLPQAEEGRRAENLDSAVYNFEVICLDIDSGKEIWRVDRDEKSNWGTPIIWKNSIRTELVLQGLKTRSYNPENGRLLWEIDMGGGRNITSPTAESDMIFVGNEKRSNGGGTLFGIKAGASGDISLKEGESSNNWVVWSIPESGIAMASPLVYEGLLYMVDRNRGQIVCIEAATGNVVYPGAKITGAKAFWASPWAFDGKIYCLEEKGTTHVIQAGREFKELGQNKLNDIFWSSTAIAKGSYIFRGEKGIYCVK